MITEQERIEQQEIVRVLRVIEYEGPRWWVEEAVTKSIQGERRLEQDKVIRAATVGTYPQILESGGGQHQLDERWTLT